MDVKPSGLVTAVAPSIGPAVITVAGVDVPLLALSLSMFALVLARYIAPPALEKLTGKQEFALTLLLVLLLFLAVTDQLPIIGKGEPLGVGMSVTWGIGLGFSGMLVVRLMRDRVVALIKAALGTSEGGQG